MKTKSFKKALCMMLCAATVTSVSVFPALAADVCDRIKFTTTESMMVPTPRYDQTNRASSRLKIVDGKAGATATVVGGSQVTKVTINATLQKKNGSKWTDVKSWSETSSSRNCTLNKETAVGKGTYRLHVSFTTYVGTKKESGTVNSNTATY